MEKEINKILIKFADLLFWLHIFWVIFVLFGVFYRFPGILWDMHLWASALIIVGVIINECPLTTLERWIRRKSGHKSIPNRGSRFLEVFYLRTGKKLPNSLMRILGLVYFILGVGVHFIG